MNNAQINQAFFVATDAKTKSEVLGAIAEHYGISPQEAYAEVVSDGAEHLLDYLTEPIRSAVNVLFQRHRIAA